MTTTVITTQAASVVPAPSMRLRPAREWTTGIFNCFDDIPSCIVAYFCPVLMECWLASTADEFICLPMFVPGASIAIRAKVRAQNNIRGSICNDCVLYHFCHPCMLAQTKREIDFVRQAQVV